MQRLRTRFLSVRVPSKHKRVSVSDQKFVIGWVLSNFFLFLFFTLKIVAVADRGMPKPITILQIASQLPFHFYVVVWHLLFDPPSSACCFSSLDSFRIQIMDFSVTHHSACWQKWRGRVRAGRQIYSSPLPICCHAECNVSFFLQ